MTADPVPTDRDERPSLVRNLMDRRVPQIFGLYVAGGWGFLQFVDWVVEQ